MRAPAPGLPAASACQAVSAASGTAPAVRSGTSSGTRAHHSSRTVTYSAYEPRESGLAW